MDMIGKVGGMGSLSGDILGKSPEELSSTSMNLESYGSANLFGFFSGPAEEPSNPSQSRVVGQTELSDTINTARRMMMAGRPWIEIDQHLSSQFEKGTPEFEGIQAEFGLLGPIYWDRKAFSNCRELENHWKQQKIKKTADTLLMDSQCLGCKKLLGSRCPRTGMLVAKEMDWSKAIIQGLGQRMAANGLISPRAMIDSRESLKAALIKGAGVDGAPRQYQGPAIARMSTDSISAATIAEYIAQAESDRDNRDRTVESISYDKNVRPMLKFIAENILRGMEGTMLRKATEVKGFSRDFLAEHQKAIKGLVCDPLIRSKLVIHASLYDRCAEMAEFLKQNNLRIPFVLGTADCLGRNCHNQGICTRLGCRLITDYSQVDQVGIDSAIDELRSKNRITASQAAECKAMEKVLKLSGLAAALNSIPSVRSVPVKCLISQVGQDAFEASAKHFADREEAVLWAAGQIRDGTPVSRIRQSLSGNGWADISQSLIETAIRHVAVVKASALDDCTRHKYLFAPGTVLVKDAGKCGSCQYSDPLFCNHQRVIFSTSAVDPIVGSFETPEIQEIRERFAGCNMGIDIKPKTRQKVSEIRLDNPGTDMIVDVGRNDKSEKENLQKLFTAPGMAVEIKGRPEMTGTPMEITLSGAGDSFCDSIL